MPLHLPRFPAAGPVVSAFLWMVLGAMPLAAATHPEAAEPGISVSTPWIRMIVSSRPAAGYLTLANDSAQPRTVISAASPGCGMLMLHRSVAEGGVEQMAMVKSIVVPAHGSVTFAPGGYHLMCMSPAAGLKHGAAVPVTLSFADGGSVTADFPVRNAIGK